MLMSVAVTRDPEHSFCSNHSQEHKRTGRQTDTQTETERQTELGGVTRDGESRKGKNGSEKIRVCGWLWEVEWGPQKSPTTWRKVRWSWRWWWLHNLHTFVSCKCLVGPLFWRIVLTWKLSLVRRLRWANGEPVTPQVHWLRENYWRLHWWLQAKLVESYVAQSVVLGKFYVSGHYFFWKLVCVPQIAVNPNIKCSRTLTCGCLPRAVRFAHSGYVGVSQHRRPDVHNNNETTSARISGKHVLCVRTSHCDRPRWSQKWIEIRHATMLFVSSFLSANCRARAILRN